LFDIVQLLASLDAQGAKRAVPNHAAVVAQATQA